MSNIKMGLTIEEAAECTGIGRNTMRKLVDWGKLPVLKVGRKAIIRRDTLERFMSVNQGRNLLNENDVRKVEYSTKEIAPLVHLTTGAIYARLDHLRKKLRKIL